MTTKTETVDGYIKGAPKWAQSILRELRRAIQGAVPTATESISYHMPYYSDNGRLAYFGYHTKHVGFYWIGAGDKKSYAKELATQKVVGTSLHVQMGGKVPVSLIKKIVIARKKANAVRKAAKTAKKAARATKKK